MGRLRRVVAPLSECCRLCRERWQGRLWHGAALPPSLRQATDRGASTQGLGQTSKGCLVSCTQCNPRPLTLPDLPILIEEPDGLQASWFSRNLQRFPKPCESGHVVRFSVVFAGGPSREGVRESNIRGSSGLRLVLLFVCPCRRLPRLGRGQGRQRSQTLQPKAHEKESY